MKILSQLNDIQKKAVTYCKGPLLLIAGAGSGKTRVLTHKIAYLISQGIVSENIIALTFTNKAAKEMSHRVKALLFTENKKSNVLPFIGTFHGFCLQVLRKEKFPYADFIIYDEEDQKKIAKEIIEEHGSSGIIKPSSLLNAISKAKNEYLNSLDYQKNAENDFERKIIFPLYLNYEKKMNQFHALDFDDLLFKTVELLKTHPLILEKYQNKFRYILVDEYQDTNTLQYTLLRLIADKHKNICVVGDEDQAIYGWRGADFKNILNFENDYHGANVIKLEENYRSTKNILGTAQSIISKNTFRKEKNLWTNNLEGEKITIAALHNHTSEASFVINSIIEIIEKGGSLKDIAIVYRTNAQSRALEEECLKHNISYALIGAYRFYERKEIKDIISYLRVIENKNDIFSLKRIINTPPRKLSLEKDFWQNWESEGDEKAIGKLDGKKRKYLNVFFELIERWRELKKIKSVSELIAIIIDESGYKKYFDDGSADSEQRIENLNELVNVAKEFNNNVSSFLESVALFQDADAHSNNNEALHLMTLHTVKGLEFKTVFITGVEEGIVPHSRSKTQEEIEEERRLLYVGITRAKEKLFLTFAKQRMLWGSTNENMPSRFLFDIPEEKVEFINPTKNDATFSEELLIEPYED